MKMPLSSEQNGRKKEKRKEKRIDSDTLKL